jgi:hypothetical protein
MAQTAEYKRAWYQANRERQLKYSRVYNKTHREQVLARNRAYKQGAEYAGSGEEGRRRNKEYVAQQKVGKICTMCHKEADPRKLLFHHVDPATKCFNLGSPGARSIQAIIDEIAKCVVWCRSCHGKFHNTLHS